ncbi:hypothetical protein PFICI_08630 [Pestalotiopsis fici W106-1]|uniref:Iron-sulfur assembly protein 1 n=1 Tax=Pestalotiopsis fici (strain W106-1 / CGMCC3.15140) TaxID=1229662 RepID=W3X0A1_PESFW|nr:uncharacterized protein PFICI_08630 [Pestalotiopsis fici W106-1]ETS78777.1 hypothetical protein PFICI_08630 [Pestalotiopsis fici W106-1]
MNAPRLVLDKAAPSLLLSRLALPTSRSSRPCQHLLRQFSQSKYWTASSEKISSTPSYQPYPLAKPTGPRSNLPESSIASPIPQVHETRPPQPAVTPSGPKEPSPQTATSSSLPEQETQKPKPAPERKRKLRPRKAAMKLTPSAVEHLREMLEGPEPKMIKIGVRNRGCSGLAYHLDWVDKAGPFDETVEQDGVKVLIDSKALFSIIGSEMDWIEDKLSQRFTFKNPNIKEECGCGESFMV